jgi:hypothetical protein
MPARKPPASSRSHRAAWTAVGLGMAIHLARDRRVQATVVAWGIGLAVLRRLGMENQQRTLARLAAWDKRVTQRVQRDAQHVRREIRDAKREIGG